MRQVETRVVRVGNVAFGGTHPFVFIGGPCVIENDSHPFKMAERIAAITTELDIPYIFKASFDKANRTSTKSFRGPGLEQGLEILRGVRSEHKVPVTTDLHEASQAEQVAAAVDLIQIPAFLCRQTDLILAAAQTGKPVNIKKGQFLAPWDIRYVVDKAMSTGNSNISITERGTSFGYNNLVVDLRGFPVMRETGCPLVFDVTHSLQLPGGAGSASSGNSRYILEVASGGVATGVDGVFMEVHDQPLKALSDGPNACPLDQLRSVLVRLLAIQTALRETP